MPVFVALNASAGIALDVERVDVTLLLVGAVLLAFLFPIRHAPKIPGRR